MPIPIHYIEVKKNDADVPEELIVLRSGESEPTCISLRQADNRESDIAGVGNRASLDPQTGELLQLAGKFI